MTALVFETSIYGRSVITALLTEAGFKNVLVTGNATRFSHLLKEEATSLRLIVLSSRLREEIHIKLAQTVAEMKSLNHVPVLYLSDSEQTPKRSASSRFTLRVDCFVCRPFGLDKLRRSIDQAFVNRARARDIIVVLADAAKEALKEAIFEFDSEFHWQGVIFVSNRHELQKAYEEHGWRIGAILIDPKKKTANLRDEINNFRRSQFGALTPFVLLSQSSRDTFHVRDLCDLFIGNERGDDYWAQSDWLPVLRQCSERLINAWSSRQAIVLARQLMKNDELIEAHKILEQALKRDEDRSDLMELLGQVEEKRGRFVEATKLYNLATSINPCAPFSYLRLLDIVDTNIVRNELVAKSVNFCPTHPQLKTKIQEIRAEAAR